MKAVIEDLSTGLDLTVSTVYLKLYKPRSEIFDSLPKDLKIHVGETFNILPGNLRSEIIRNLRLAGFDTQRTLDDGDSEPKVAVSKIKKIVRNVDKKLKTVHDSKNNDSNSSIDIISEISCSSEISDSESESNVSNNQTEGSNNTILDGLMSSIDRGSRLVKTIKRRVRRLPIPADPPWISRLRSRKEK